MCRKREYTFLIFIIQALIIEKQIDFSYKLEVSTKITGALNSVLPHVSTRNLGLYEDVYTRLGRNWSL